MLKTQDLNVFYGGIHALKGVSIDVPAGEIVTIIGSNGAGKSSLLNAISGMVKYTGSVEYEGKPLPRQPHKVVKNGICQVPEGRIIFANLTVHENLKMGRLSAQRRQGNQRRLRPGLSVVSKIEGKRKPNSQEPCPAVSSDAGHGKRTVLLTGI